MPRVRAFQVQRCSRCGARRIRFILPEGESSEGPRGLPLGEYTIYQRGVYPCDAHAWKIEALNKREAQLISDALENQSHSDPITRNGEHDDESGGPDLLEGKPPP